MSSGAAAAAALKDLTAVDEWPRNMCAVCGETTPFSRRCRENVTVLRSACRAPQDEIPFG